MAELYRIENETLTSMADKIRILSGAEGTMTTAQMVNSLDEANTEVATQTTLISEQDAKIAELAEILSGKASGGGNTNIETCTVSIDSNGYDICAIDYTTVNDNGNIEYKCLTPNSNENQVLTCVCGSNISISMAASGSGNCFTSYNGVTNSYGILIQRNYFVCVNVIANSNETMIITLYTNSGGSND